MPQGMTATPVPFAALPGWDQDQVIEALPALRRTCAKIERRSDLQDWVGPGALGGQVKDWQSWCEDLNRALPENQPLGPNDALTLRAVLESRLQPYAVTARKDDGSLSDQGTFTGYYEASLKGATRRQPGYEVPLYGPPDDLVKLDLGQAYGDLKGQKVVGRLDAQGRVHPYWTRAEIDGGAIEQTLGAAKTPVVAWAADPVDAHILHIQGSGVLDLPDGGTMQVGYAGNNGQRFVGIGRVMLDRKLVASGQASMPAIRAWLKDHPDQAESVLQANPRFIFFRALNGAGPLGAMGVALTPQRSMAVDTRYVALGTPLWLDSVDPDGEPLQRLMVAQDVGSAIKGVVRGDFFWGAGEPALAKAGRMKSGGTYYLLLPRPADAPQGAAQ
jgi:membrane-bound lytic murein transglycosylase A